ncbi:MAG: hypothetical protein WBI18_01100 [Candidatus Saccharicenans sp.]
MRRKTIIKFLIIISVFVLVYYFVYNPVLSWKDQKLIERSKLLQEANDEEAVIRILGKPQMIEKVDLVTARSMGMSSDILEKIKNKEQKSVVVYWYYVPKLVPPLFLRHEPFRTIIMIFLDEYHNVLYVEISKTSKSSLIPGGIDIMR